VFFVNFLFGYVQADNMPAFQHMSKISYRHTVECGTVVPEDWYGMLPFSLFSTFLYLHGP